MRWGLVTTGRTVRNPWGRPLFPELALVDANGEQVVNVYGERLFRFEEVVTDGQRMLRLEPFYVGRGKLFTGPFAGCQVIWVHIDEMGSFVSDLHVHRAFVASDGVVHPLELSAFMASKGEDGLPASVPVDEHGGDAWTMITMAEAVSAAEARNAAPDAHLGWHAWSVHEQHLVGLMMAFEAGTMIVRSRRPEGVWPTTRVDFHGVTDVMGSVNNEVRCWLPGLETRAGELVVDGEPTGRRAIVGSTWPTTVLTDGPFEDLFVGADENDDRSRGVLGDPQVLLKDCAVYQPACTNGSLEGFRGPFCLYGTRPTLRTRTIGFRLARWVVEG